MKASKRSVSVLAVATGFGVGCSSEEETATEAGGGDATASAHVGHWKTETCTAESDQSFLANLNLGASSAVISLKMFSDTACTNKNFTYEYSYDYKAEASGTSGVYKIDETLQKISIEINNSTLVDLFNASSIYGKTDWALDTAADVTGKSSGNGTSDAIEVGTVYYDLYQVMDGKLCFGLVDATHDGTTSETRPTEISTTDCMVKDTSLGLKVKHGDTGTMLDKLARKLPVH